MSKLRIGIVSCDLKRSKDILESLQRKELETVMMWELHGLLETPSTTYEIIPNNPNNFKGKSVDQVILDYALLSIKDEISSMLQRSYVPEEYQIIDDRNILM